MQLTSAKTYVRFRKISDIYMDNENIQMNKKKQSLQNAISFLRA